MWEPLVDEGEPALPTPQRQACESPADVLFYGGAAGGGKTDLLIGLALTQHRRAIIFRRTFTQLRAIEDRVAEILGGRAGYNAQARVWQLLDGRRLEFGACQHPGDERAFQGRPHDLKAFDEVTHFTEAQVRFLMGWLRTTVAGQRCRVVCTGNPPTTSEGDWVMRVFGPWLDPQHPNPARPGELRWYATVDGEERECETGAPLRWRGETIRPLSRSFIPSRVEDNPYLIRAGYKATLQALPEPLRSQMLEGAFGAGREDDPWAVVPTAWIEAAQERWRTHGGAPSDPMTALGVDPARGGRDETVVAPRHGAWFARQIVQPGHATPDGPAVASLVVSLMRDGAVPVVDVIGIGSSVYDHLRTAGVRAQAFNGAAASHGRDRTGQLGFYNARAEAWWRMREALDPASGERLCLPPDPRLRADLAAPRWKLTARGVLVEAKDALIKRLGRSPDRGEAAVYALMADTARRVRRAPQPQTDYDVLRY